MSARATKPETSADIDDAAAAWVARADRGSLLPNEAQQLDAWLAADPRRLGAFARAKAISVHFDRARALGPSFVAARSSWRSLSRWTYALAASAAIITVATALLLTLSADKYSTAVGEMRQISAADGSRIVLNTASTVAVDYSGSERRIELIKGEALFTVAKDPNRPFIVEINGMQVRAVGTSFTVRRMPDEAVQVLVREGVVEVTKPAQHDESAPVRLPANTRAFAPPEQAVQIAPLSAAEVTRELSWQEGMISLSGLTLREAAAEFARYSDMRIVIDDPAVADRTVTGLFAANNPMGFAQAIGTSMSLAVRAEGKAVHLLPMPSPATR